MSNIDTCIFCFVKKQLREVINNVSMTQIDWLVLANTVKDIVNNESDFVIKLSDLNIYSSLRGWLPIILLCFGILFVVNHFQISL